MTDQTSDSYNLADHHDEVAELLDLIIDTYERQGGELTATLDVMRAAAVIARRHQQLLDAIGNPDELRVWVAEYNGIKLRTMALRIAAAVSSGTPTPTTCPTCGSTQPAAPHTGRWWRRDDGELLNQHGPCPDPWHQELTED